MSVVNKMLKDLEQRDKQSVYEADYVPLESRSAKSRKMVVGVAVLLFSAAIITWFLLPNDNSKLAKPSSVAAKKPSNLLLLPKNDVQLDSSGMLLEEMPTGPQRGGELSELDLATLQSLENAKEAEAAATRAQAKLEKVTKELDDKLKLVAAQTENQSPTQTQAQQQVNQQVENDFIAQAPATPSNSVKEPVEPSVFSVSSSNTSTSSNRMLEQRIQLSLKNGDTASALKDLNSLIALEPRNASARKRLASLEFAQGNPKRAALLLDQGMKLSPEDSSMRLMQARLLFREDRAVQALSILKDHPNNVIADNDLLSFRAALAEKQKDYATSLQDYAALLKRQPNNARWMLGLAISQDKQKMHEEAVISYKKVKSSNQLSAQVNSFVDGRLAALVGS